MERLETTDTKHQKPSQCFVLVKKKKKKKCIAWLRPHSKVDRLASLVTRSRGFDAADPSCCVIGLALEMKHTNQMMHHV